MTLEQLARWLDAYGQAWERRDVHAFVGLFAEDAVYAWGPFNEPLRGRAAIRARTREAVAAQRDVSFAHEPLAITPDGRGIARWRATFRIADRDVVEEDVGIFLVTLDSAGRCSEFREWWSQRERPAR